MTLAAKISGSKLAALLICIAGAFSAGPAAGEIATDAVLEAVRRYVCFEVYWMLSRAPFEPGQTVPVTIRKDSEIAYLWIEGLVRGRSDGSPLSNYYKIHMYEGEAGVLESKVTSGDSKAEHERAEFKELRNQVFRGATQTAQLTMPKDCTPRYGKTTPLKQRKLMAVDRAMARLFQEEMIPFWRFAGPADGKADRKKVKIVIADFNVDYPSTFVLVPSMGKVWLMGLRDSSDSRDEARLDEGEYWVEPGWIEYTTEDFKRKILKHGVVRFVRPDAGP